MSLSEEILSIYQARGAEAYFGERVSMTEHGLQAAHFAAAEGAPDPLILAALLHDIGHLLEAVPDAIEDWTVDARHEELGARWLAVGRVARDREDAGETDDRICHRRMIYFFACLSAALLAAFRYPLSVPR